MAATYVTFDKNRKAWKYQRPVKPAWRKVLGTLQYTVWLKDATNERTAVAASLPYRMQHDSLFGWLSTLKAAELAQLEARGGLPAAKLLAPAAPILRHAIEIPAADVRETFAGYPEGSRVARMGLASFALAVADGTAREAALLQEAEKAEALVLKAEPASNEKLSALLSVWIKSQGDGWKGRTSDHKRALDDFIAYLKRDKPYRDVTQGDAMGWRNSLADDPSVGYYKQRDSLRRVSALFAAAKQRDEKLKSNPFKDVTPIGAKPDARVVAAERGFKAAELRKLVKTAVAIKWGGERHALAMWALRLCIYTGARPHEVLQLQKGDVYKVGKAVVVHLRDADANKNGECHPLKSIKNNVSRREVPLHPAVAGFLKFAQKSETDQIFECFPHDKEKGRTVWFSQNFTVLREAAGLPEGKVFYGLRNTYISTMRDVGIHADRARHLVGHATGDVHGDIYLMPSKMAVLVKDVAAVDPMKD